VEAFDGAAEFVARDARVPLGRVEVLVSEQLLDLAFTPKLRSAYESSPLVTSVRVFRIPTPLGLRKPFRRLCRLNGGSTCRPMAVATTGVMPSWLIVSVVLGAALVVLFALVALLDWPEVRSWLHRTFGV
jgi:hypothetical protein